MIQPVAPSAITKLLALAGPGPAQAETQGFSAGFEALLAQGLTEGLAASGNARAQEKALPMPVDGKPGGKILPFALPLASPVGAKPVASAIAQTDAPAAPDDEAPEEKETPQSIAIAGPLAIAVPLEIAAPKPATGKPDRVTPAQQPVAAPVGQRQPEEAVPVVADTPVLAQKITSSSKLEVPVFVVQLTPLDSSLVATRPPVKEAARLTGSQLAPAAMPRPASLQLTIPTDGPVLSIAPAAAQQPERLPARKTANVTHSATLVATALPDQLAEVIGEMPVAASQPPALPVQASGAAFLPAAAPRQVLVAATEASDSRPRPRTASALADLTATSDAARLAEPAMPPLLAMREAATFGPPAAAPAAAPVLPAHDFAALVDRLVEAREAGLPVQGPLAVAAALSHGEFGKVTLRFEQDGGNLSVAMASADPDFLPAVQAAAASAQSSAGQTAPSSSENAASAPRQDSAGQQAAASNPGQSEAQARSQPRGAVRDAPTANPARSAPTAPSDEPGDRRGGIYA